MHVNILSVVKRGIMGEGVMDNKIRLKKLYTQHSLQWSLKVGSQLGTLTRDQAVKLVNVKPVIFHRWISGKLAAPAIKLDKIKRCAFAELRRPYKKTRRLNQETESDIEIMKAKFLWKNMIFDQLHMVAKRRFCAGLKKVYR